MMKLNFTTASDQGWVRGNNEDSAYAGPHLLALADGMGGHAAGEVASQLMIHHLAKLDANPEDNDMLALLASVADDANRAIARGVREVPETDGMGTTLTALMFNGTEFGMCHVGDSRAYRLRDGKLEQITVDDTYVQSLVDKGELAPEDVCTHPRRSLILKAYTGRPVEPTLKTIDARVGDRLLLCSDGLSDPVTATTIEETLRQGTPEDAAFRLIELALRSGGPDNVTVVVADVVDGSTPDATLPTVGITAGALNAATQKESSHPDTAASRAARALQERKPQTIEPKPPASQAAMAPGAHAGEETSASSNTNSDKPEGRKKRTFLAPLIALLAVILVALGGLWWFNSSVDDTYFVATDGEEIVIEQGTNSTVLGKSMHQIYQRACLDQEDNLTLVAPDDASDCHRLSMKDLKESARGQVASLPEGPYDDVLKQMQRLADEALPVCVTRASREAEPSEASSTAATSTRRSAESTPETSDSETSTSAAAESSSRTASVTPTRSPGDLSSPGTNCREV